MPDHRPKSFDTRGFRFAVLCLIVIAVVFSAVRYGTALASDAIIASGFRNLAETELKLTELITKRKTQPAGAAETLQKLQEYEDELATRTIGTASIDTLALAHERLIAADLSTMKLYLFENGRATTTFDILSKGKRGSRWETPTGLYEIETKAEDHFSSIGEVHMPYSMQFFGNFFIHGWPYYPGGEPVPEGYSGGCIRLSTEDSQKVYAFAQAGTPIFVWEGSASSTPIEVSDRALPQVSAKAFLVADIKTGTVFAGKNVEAIYPIASLSKLLTALVANETIHFDRMLAITRDDRKQTEGTPGNLAQDDMFTIGDLLYPLLMESNNSVAYSLARYTGEANFVRWMNDKAKAIGMANTSMEDPSGLSPHNTSTASDLFRLMRYIHDSQSFILNVSRLPQHIIEAEDGTKYTLGNFNHFAGNPEFIGGKTGYTPEARETFSSIFEVPVDGEEATIAIIILQSEERKADVQALLNWFKKAASVE